MGDITVLSMTRRTGTSVVLEFEGATVLVTFPSIRSVQLDVQILAPRSVKITRGEKLPDVVYEMWDAVNQRLSKGGAA